MNKNKILVVLALFVGLFISNVAASQCRTSYMHDSCGTKEYSIVEIEKPSYGGHNHIDLVHHFNDIKSTTNRRDTRVKKRYVKKCRTVVKYR